jgi:NAD-dependent protein deacetylase/lipoamidase
MMNDHLKEIFENIAQSSQRIVVLTGSGISAESGIPTFRGVEGYWRVGSKEYTPQEFATHHMFSEMPDEVWKWYLYRRGMCRKARPNPGHLAIAEIERLFPDRFTLITQNIDGLHMRAGNSRKNTYEIHGNLFFMRCDRECSHAVYPIPDDVSDKAKGEGLTDSDRQLLRCPKCGGPTRPHVLWFDETYNEEFYYYVSSLKMASQAGLLLVIGTSGSTNLPILAAQKTLRRNGIIVDINIQENPFSSMATKSGGDFLQETSSIALPGVLKVLGDTVRNQGAALSI